MGSSDIYLLQMILSCIVLHSHSPKHRMTASYAWSKDIQRLIIRRVQKPFLESNPKQPEMLVIGRSADTLAHSTRRQKRSTLRNEPDR